MRISRKLISLLLLITIIVANLPIVVLAEGQKELMISYPEIKIKKVNIEGKALEGAEFKIEPYNVLDDERGDEEPPEEDEENLSFNLNGLLVFNSNNLASTNSDTKYTTDSQGYTDVFKLSPGKYTITEIKAPEGYKELENPIDLTISKSGDDYKYSIENGNNAYISKNEEDEVIVTVINEPKDKGIVINASPEIKIKKINIEGEALEGAEFKVEPYDVLGDEEPPADDEPPADEEPPEPLTSSEFNLSSLLASNSNNLPSTNSESEYITDSQGYTDLFELSAGEYTIREIKAPEGYKELEDSIKLTINKSGNDYKYSIENGNNAYISKNEKNQVIITVINELKDKEVVTTSSPEIKIKKINIEGEALGGAEFIVESDDVYDEGSDPEPPEDHALIMNRESVNMEDIDEQVMEEDIKQNQPIDYDDQNLLKYGEKYEDESGKEGEQELLEGEHIDNYELDEDQNDKLLESKVNSIFDLNSLLASNSNNLASTNIDKKYTTDPQGYTELFKLSPGEYTITEEKAPEGYKRLEDLIKLTISKSGDDYKYSIENGNNAYISKNEENEIIVTVINEPIDKEVVIKVIPEIKIKKINIEGEALEGAEFKVAHHTRGDEEPPEEDEENLSFNLNSLLASNSNNLASTNIDKKYTTDPQGYTELFKLSPGEYTITEEKAPEGYKDLEDSIKLTINKSGNDYKYSIENGNNAYISKNEENEVIVTVINELKDKDVVIKVIPEIKIEKVNIEGKGLKGAEFKVEPYDVLGDEEPPADEEPPEPLTSSEFNLSSLLASNSNNPPSRNSESEYITDSQGYTDVFKLSPGEYTITEIKAPEGYKELENPIKLTISQGEEGYKYSIEGGELLETNENEIIIRVVNIKTKVEDDSEHQDDKKPPIVSSGGRKSGNRKKDKEKDKAKEEEMNNDLDEKMKEDKKDIADTIEDRKEAIKEEYDKQILEKEDLESNQLVNNVTDKNVIEEKDLVASPNRPKELDYREKPEGQLNNFDSLPKTGEELPYLNYILGVIFMTLGLLFRKKNK